MLLTSVPMIAYANDGTESNTVDDYNEIAREYDADKSFIDSMMLTVDSDTMKIDGAEISLDEKLTMVDGTAMIPLDLLCKYISAKYSESNENTAMLKSAFFWLVSKFNYHTDIRLCRMSGIKNSKFGKCYIYR
jgi:hypothetical protein